MSRVEAPLPNLVIPGVAKAGTTSLFWYLAQHPDVCAADLKQINHFAPLRYGEPPAPLESYAAHFRHCRGEAYRLDASPTYLSGGPAIIDAVRTHLPDARVLIILRDPASRLWSSYRFKRSHGRLPSDMSFGRFVDRCAELRRSGADRRRENAVYQALSLGFYHEHVPPWLDAFGADARVVFFEDLVVDPHRVLREICLWLGIPPEPVETIDVSVRNPTMQPRSRRLQAWAIAANARAYHALRRLPGLKSVLRAGYYSMNGRTGRGSPHEEDLRAARSLYAGSVRMLADDLHERGYDRLPVWLSQDGDRGGHREGRPGTSSRRLGS